MSMSTHVKGFKPPDEKWLAMKKVYDSCKAAGIDPPHEVSRFFDHDEPDDKGVEVSEKKLMECGALKRWGEEMREGFELDVTKLPPDVKVIRFYNSY